jgi:hypothetical protein
MIRVELTTARLRIECSTVSPIAFQRMIQILPRIYRMVVEVGAIANPLPTHPKIFRDRGALPPSPEG